MVSLFLTVHNLVMAATDGGLTTLLLHFFEAVGQFYMFFQVFFKCAYFVHSKFTFI